MRIRAEVRRERLKELIAKGITSISELSNILEVPRETIYNDLNAVKKQIKKYIEKEPLDKFLLEFITNYDQIGKELWKVYNEASHESAKVGALKQLKELKKDKAKIMQDLGILERVPDKIEMSNTVNYNDFAAAYEEYRRIKKSNTE